MKIARQISLLTLAALMLLPAAPVSADPGVTSDAANVRAGPGTRFSVIDSLPRGAALDIESCEASWCFVVYDAGRSDGWISRRYVAEIDVPRQQQRRRYREPTYDQDPFDDPFCDRFSLSRPYGCDRFPTPIPFPTPGSGPRSIRPSRQIPGRRGRPTGRRGDKVA